jgi:hypothetical protein
LEQFENKLQANIQVTNPKHKVIIINDSKKH